MTKIIVLKWEEVGYDELSEMEDSYFYAFSRNLNLIYLGTAYHQSIVYKIKSEIMKFEMDMKRLTIWIGHIVESDFKQITEQIVKDIECLLIHVHRPTYNTRCIANYTGRNNLKVRNHGCPYLRPCIKVEEDHIYKTC